MRGQTVLFLFLLLLSACSGRGKGDAGERIITVTMEPQRYFTEAIAGDKFTVRSMVPKGSSPETYDPTPQQLVSLGESEAYLRIGYIGFERSWMDRLMNNTPHIQVFDTSTGVDLIFESALRFRAPPSTTAPTAMKEVWSRTSGTPPPTR